MALPDLAQEILAHAQTGVSEDGQKVRNNLSPHMERFIVERVRSHIIKEAKAVQAACTNELASLEALMPESVQNHIKLTATRINAYITQLYK